MNILDKKLYIRGLLLLLFMLFYFSAFATSLLVQRPSSPTLYSLVNPRGITGLVGSSQPHPNIKCQEIYGGDGSRVTPEFPSVINPPSVLNLRVTATLNEGNNFANMRYNPLYFTSPLIPNTLFGDYSILGTVSPPLLSY